MPSEIKQVGGNHYDAKDGYQHWDWVVDMQMPYLPATATKYITRWRKKNGYQDLEKALTYFQKLRYEMDRQPFVSPGLRHGWMTDRFIEANNLTGLDAKIIICMSGTRDHAMISLACQYTEELMLQERLRKEQEHRDMAGGA